MALCGPACRLLWVSTLGDDQQALLRIRSCLASPGFSSLASLGAGSFGWQLSHPLSVLKIFLLPKVL